MSVAVCATLIAAGYAPVPSAFGWMVRTGSRCFCKLPADPTAMLIAAAELVHRCDRGEA